MITPDDHILRALIRLNSDEEYKYLKIWLADSYQAQLIENSEIGPEVNARWGQGKAQQLKELVELFIDARKLLDLKQKKK